MKEGINHNLNEIFILIQNIMLQTNLPQINYNTSVNNPNNLDQQEAPTPNSNIMMPDAKLESNNNESYFLLFQIPLFNGKCEDIKIDFLKFEKNIYKVKLKIQPQLTLIIILM